MNVALPHTSPLAHDNASDARPLGLQLRRSLWRHVSGVPQLDVRHVVDRRLRRLSLVSPRGVVLGSSDMDRGVIRTPRVMRRKKM